MKRSRIIALFFLVGLLCCNKYNKLPDDANGSDFIRGRLFLYNYVSGNYVVSPLAKKTVTVAYPNTQSNYIEKTLTDTAGYFIFANMNNTQKYEIKYTDTINGLIVTADTIIKPAQDSLSFVARPSMTANTGFELVFIDNTANRGTIPNVQACVFTSSLLVTDSCQGSVYQLTSDVYGRVSQFGLRNMIYYILTKSKTASLPYDHVDTINLLQMPFSIDTIRIP
jgi:hypothetical protein